MQSLSCLPNLKHFCQKLFSLDCHLITAWFPLSLNQKEFSFHKDMYFLHSCTRSIQDDNQSWLQITNWDMNLLLDLKSNYSKVLNSRSSKYRVDLQCHLSLHFGLHLLSVKKKMLFLCKSRKEISRLQKTVIAKPFTIRGIIVSSKFWTFLWT